MLRILVGATLAFAFTFVSLIEVFAQTPQKECRFNSISRHEMEMLIADVALTNPAALKRLSQDPALKKHQLENIRQLLAFACQAEKDGLDTDAANNEEMKSIRSETIAMNYDREVNKDKGTMPPLGSITDDQIKRFWGENTPPSISTSEKQARESDFQTFFNAKIELLKRGDPSLTDRKVTDDERQQAREFYAKIRIYESEYSDKLKQNAFDPDIVAKTDLQVKLQQAQFLARLYTDKIAEKTKVTDAEISQYIAAHPELDPEKKRAKAQEILNKAKAGEDFAALANQYTDDPGNKNQKGEGQGGLYKDVRTGQMVEPFERAALALAPGQISPELVESDYGFHIIKLEKKAASKDADGNPSQVYDVRHILIATTYDDPKDPSARPQPIKEYINKTLSDEKQAKAIDDLVAANKITVPDDFTIPAIPDEPSKTAAKVAKPKPQVRKQTGSRSKRKPVTKRALKK